MPIKKSVLEQKWYYRLLKVTYLILPLAITIIFILNNKVNIPLISQKNLADLVQKNLVNIIYVLIGVVLYYSIIPRAVFYLLFGGIEDDTKAKSLNNQATINQSAFIPLFILLMVVIIFLLSEKGYINLKNLNLSSIQTNKTKPVSPTHTYGSACTDSQGKKGIYGTNGICYSCSSGTAQTSAQGNCSSGIAGVYCCTANTNNKNNKQTKCIPTGCGTLWRCSGYYYIGGQRINVNGLCFPSGMRPSDLYSGWSGTCRQCP